VNGVAGRNHGVTDLVLELASAAVLALILVVTAIPVGLHRYRSSRRPVTSRDRAAQPATAEQAA
jgi:hypothetical protein